MPKMSREVNAGCTTWRMPAMKRRTPTAQNTNHLPISAMRSAEPPRHTVFDHDRDDRQYHPAARPRSRRTSSIPCKSSNLSPQKPTPLPAKIFAGAALGESAKYRAQNTERTLHSSDAKQCRSGGVQRATEDDGALARLYRLFRRRRFSCQRRAAFRPGACAATSFSRRSPRRPASVKPRRCSV